MDQFFKDIRRLDKSAFSLTTGFRAAAFAIAPIILGFALHQPTLLLATLGAIFLTNTEKAFYTIPWRILLVACFTEASELRTGNSCRYHKSSIVPYITWNRYICSSYRLGEYKVGSCWYIHGNHFRCWSGFAWLFNTISRCEDTFFSYRNVMGAARYRDSTFCSIAQNTTTVAVRKCGK